MTTAPKPPLGRDVNSNGEGSFWRLTNALFSLHGLTSSTERNIQHGLVVFGEPAREHFFLYSNEVAFLPAENLLPQPFPKFHFAAFSAGLERFYRFFLKGRDFGAKMSKPLQSSDDFSAPSGAFLRAFLSSFPEFFLLLCYCYRFSPNVCYLSGNALDISCAASLELLSRK